MILCNSALYVNEIDYIFWRNAMNHGDLMKNKREERHFSRKKLSQNICSFSYLQRFENYGGKMDIDTFILLLERMNIRIDEYYLEYQNFCPSRKDKYRERFKQSILQPNLILAFISDLENEYCDTKDIFYMYLLVELKAIIQNLPNQPNIAISSNEISTLHFYLESVNNWEYFELAMYTNCLALFDSSYLLFNHEDVLTKFHKFSSSFKYKQACVKFLVNSIILCLEKKDYEDVPNLLEKLYCETEDSDYFKGRLYWYFFNSIFQQISGNIEFDIENFLIIFSRLGYNDDLENFKDIINKVL